MKREAKSVFKSKIKWVGPIGIVLSALSIFVHFLLARFTEQDFGENHSSVTIFSWRPIFHNSEFPRTSPLHRRLWGPVRHLDFLHPDANPRGLYADPGAQTNRFIFVRIQGGFHEIKNSICDAVVVARLLNATLVIPQIQSTTSSKGISSDFKSFSYLYNEEQFMGALAKTSKWRKPFPIISKEPGEKRRFQVLKCLTQLHRIFICTMFSRY